MLAMEKPLSIHPDDLRDEKVGAQAHDSCLKRFGSHKRPWESLLNPRPSLMPGQGAALHQAGAASSRGAGAVRGGKRAAWIHRCVAGAASLPLAELVPVFDSNPAATVAPADDPTVPAGSKTPTFASVKLFIDNDRWGWQEHWGGLAALRVDHTPPTTRPSPAPGGRACRLC